MPQTSPAAICLIVAAAENGVIGRDGRMPWHLPSELKYFRSRTMGKPVIMGRKTFQSIGKPLPGRTNIVITRDQAFTADGTTVVGSLEEALAAARIAASASGVMEIMVLGGAEIFRQALPLAARVYLTRVATNPEGDTYFPALNSDQWLLLEETVIQASTPDMLGATACVYQRIK